MNNIEHVCNSVLKNCKTITSVKRVQAHVYKSGLVTDVYVAGKLLLHCAVSISGALDYAHRLFLEFPKPDVFMYNTLIRGLSHDSPEKSFHTFVDMCRRSIAPPDSFSFAFILKAASNLRSVNVGIQLHCHSLKYGLDTHLFVGTTLITMYAECNFLDFARKVFHQMPQPNVVAWNAVVTASFRCSDVNGAEELFNLMPLKNLTSWNIMLDGYTKVGKCELAKKFFSDMPTKDNVSWNTMIVGFAQNCLFDEAFSFFKEMQRIGLKPNEVSLTGVLSACAQAGAYGFGKVVHGYIEKAGFVWTGSVNNALLDTYSKCGNLKMARLVFKRMAAEKTILTWTSMIAGLAMQGYGEEAIALFHRMEDSGFEPDGIIFISLLYACSHSGLIELGCEYFSKMKEVYGVEPAIEHYGCMVDLYGRAGMLQKAYDFVTQMKILPNIVIWRTLLGACSIHGNVELAEKIKEKLTELDPKNSGDNVLLSNIYAIAGKWKDVDTVRKLMVEQRLKKIPGWSVIEVDKVMYRFVAGEKGGGDIVEEAYEKLREMMSRIKVEGGYMAETGCALHDIEEEEKEDSVSTHSEKLAVAFGIARLCEGKVIRVVKNLRVCKDCHSVMKLISKVYGLEIVLRDRSRFHSFQDGFCSCRNYW